MLAVDTRKKCQLRVRGHVCPSVKVYDVVNASETGENASGNGHGVMVMVR